MNKIDYANLLLPNVNKSWEEYIKMYPTRNLNNKALVTRFAPSPTGFVHMGSLLSAMANVWYANYSKGKVFLRIEDTDQKREVENGIEGILNDFQDLNVKFDEDPLKGGDYGPYIQSQRKDIYQAFVKKLIGEDKAYPCFCSANDIENIRSLQEKKKLRIGYYGKHAKCRFLNIDEVISKINNNEKFIIRLKSPGSFYNKVILNDLIRGKIEMPENDLDIVILKSDGLPTYHFAHAVDDYLMKTTHVMRADEWISSYPIHEQLFKMLNFSLPYYAHLAPVNIKDGNTVRKISKRKDPWAAISYYNEKGIPYEVIMLYLATLLNSNFEEWYNNNPDKTIDDFEFNFNKMPISGPIFDIEKLINLSKTYFSRLKADTIYHNLLKYTEKYDLEFFNIIKNYKEYTINLLNIEREITKPRKDIASYEDIKILFWYMYDELFSQNNDDYELATHIIKSDFIIYMLTIYNQNDSQEVWFNNLSDYANTIGFTSNKKEYKENPDSFKGTTADFCKILRIFITKKNISPNLYDVLKLLGKERIINRINIYFN